MLERGKMDRDVIEIVGIPERNGRTGSVPVAVCWKVFCKSRNA